MERERLEAEKKKVNLKCNSDQKCLKRSFAIGTARIGPPDSWELSDRNSASDFWLNDFKFKFWTNKIHRILNQFQEEEKKKREEMKKAARAEREQAKKEKMELERAARIQS